ncbi:MAG: biliverdin-producing heme oxygenase [Methylobacter sp.]|nr:biliverdin-producing heme oxygenase [Methylobacter sp.]
MALLKEQTRLQHKRLETRLDLLNRTSSLDEYRVLLERFFGFYAPLEWRVLNTIGSARLDFDFNVRRKTPYLQSDLTSLGLSSNQIAQIPSCENLPDVSTVARVFGYLYVAEGSTLGGQLISKYFTQTLGVSADRNGAFFHSYGLGTGKMWREFGEAITQFADTSVSCDEITGTAIETFEKLEHWLVPGAN